jgi:hypothetical protein
MKNLKIPILPYAVLGVAIALCIISVITTNLVVIGLAIVTCACAIVEARIPEIAEAYIFRHTNLIQILGKYELCGDRQSAIYREGGKFTAISAAILDIQGDESLDRGKIENIVSHISCPFKFVTQTERINLDKISDSLLTKRSTIEIKLSRLDQTSSKHMMQINRLKREMEVVDRELKALTTGSTPLNVAHYIITSGEASSALGAEEKAKMQIRGLCSQFEAALKSKSKPVSGEELIALLENDMMVKYNGVV